MGLKNNVENPEAAVLEYGDEVDEGDGSDDDDGEDDDDFLPQRRKYSEDEGADGIPTKRQRYSPSSANGSSTIPQPSSKAHSANTPSVPRPLVPSGSKPALEHSILNVEPVDEFIRDVADFVHRLIANRREYVEIEAKIGVLRDSSGQRIRLPVATETILLPDAMPVRFESNMSASQHQNYNGLLNNLGIPLQDNAVIPRTPLKYSHTRLVDTLYPSPDSSHEKLRVTTDEATGKVVQCIKKIRLGDLNVYSPKRNADWRISVNLEVPVPQPIGAPLYSRKKDRMTYTHQYFNIDLTQVHQAMGPSATPVLLHELELEFNNAAMPVLLHAASMRHHASPPDHEFDELMRIFVNNARILVKNANSAWETGR